MIEFVVIFAVLLLLAIIKNIVEPKQKRRIPSKPEVHKAELAIKRTKHESEFELIPSSTTESETTCTSKEHILQSHIAAELNPSTGLPLLCEGGGFDIGGNAYGTSNHSMSPSGCFDSLGGTDMFDTCGISDTSSITCTDSIFD